MSGLCTFVHNRAVGSEMKVIVYSEALVIGQLARMYAKDAMSVAKQGFKRLCYN
jgi:hypothetical protein